jgi:hypothetical protein
LSEGENHQGDEVWEEVPEPEEINEEEANELPIDVFAEVESEPDESEPDESEPAGGMALAGQPKRRPDRFIDLRGGPFGHTFPRDTNLRVPVFFEQNHIRTIGHSTFVRRSAGVRWFVMINSQRMRQLNASQSGMHLLLNHEAQGHCRGFGHGEANAQVNPAFNPRVLVNA